MIQKNILKLQKNSNDQSKQILRSKEELNFSKENNVEGLSPIFEEMTNVRNDSKINSSVYKNCKKVLYDWMSTQQSIEAIFFDSKIFSWLDSNIYD